MMEKYAFDLKAEDRIIDRHTGEVIVIDLITIDEETERVIVEAHTDEHGDPWDKVLDPNAQVKVV